MGLSWSHILIVLVLFVLLFGRGKISELMGDVAQGIKAFKKGMSEEKEAEAKETPPPPVKTIDHSPAPTASPEIKTHAESEKRFGGGTV